MADGGSSDLVSGLIKREGSYHTSEVPVRRVGIGDGGSLGIAWGLCHSGSWSSTVCGGIGWTLDFGNLAGLCFCSLTVLNFCFVFML